VPELSIATLASAFATNRGVLVKVGKEQFEDPTPCQSWNVRALINHTIGAPRFAASRVAGGPAPAPDEDFAAGDFVALHDETARETLEAFGAPGVLERSVNLPFGEAPASFLMTFVAGDQLAHAWDLARATGQSTDLAPDLASELLAQSNWAVTADMRGEDGAAAFGPEREAPADACAADRLAAFLGRVV
jgi:uncharacterized protein (TIGR03086 family)